MYEPTVDKDRRTLWNELVGVSSWWEALWHVAGDFNVVCFPSEKAGTTSFTPTVHEFTEYISD